MYDTPRSIEQVLTQLTEQPKTIAKLTADLSRSRLHDAPKHGEWSINDVLAHLRSCSDMWGKYMRTIVAEDRPTIRAMNPRTWIKQTNYPGLEFSTSFRAFREQRASSWPSSDRYRAGKPRERTVLDYAQWLANHERSHVKHIARMVAPE